MRIATVVLALVAVCRLAHAGNISGCGSLTLTCSGAYVDKYCAGQTSCTPSAGCGVAGSDTCPGRCTVQPWRTCAQDSQCRPPLSGDLNYPTNDTCKGTGTFGTCRTGSPRAGESCTVAGDCNGSRDYIGSCTVASQNCCDLTVTQAYLGDTICGIYSIGQYNAGSETITGTSGVDYICTYVNLSGHSVTINAGAGDDVIIAQGSTDTIDGGEGNDIIYGGDGNDILTGGPRATSGPDTSGNDTIFGGNGNDTIVGNGGRDFLYGEGGVDTIQDTTCAFGICNQSPDDSLVGSLLCGGDGDDIINAWGPRHQCIDGGQGNDSCSYEAYFTGGRTIDSADGGTLRSCENVGICGTSLVPSGYGPIAGGTCIWPSTAPCGCD